jgi:hypothetical protein
MSVVCRVYNRAEAPANAITIARAPDLLAENTRLRARVAELEGLLGHAVHWVNEDGCQCARLAGEHCILCRSLAALGNPKEWA